MATSLKPDHYRPDIDGLRAIAVLLVVGFHAFPEWVQGGFIGVDIFFVISGYLISSIVLGQLATQRFTLAAFYARRVRRIFPALIVVLLATALVGSIVLLPGERVYLGIQIATGAAFITNFALWNTLGYFAPAIDALPLMHLWSLGIEEQFYIVWPLLLLLSFRRKNYLLLILALFALLSFVANVYSVYGDGTTAFYAPWCRVWEMAAGGLLACKQSSGVAVDRRWSSVLAIGGAVLLVAAVTLIDREKYFPGWWALLPVMSTVCLIAAGAGTPLNRWLGSRWLVAIGLISYPLYLWHWPLLSFARILEETTPAPTLRAAAVLLALLLAWLTYALVEKPVRAQPRSRWLITTLCALLLCTLLLGVWLARPPALSEADRLGSWEFEEDWVGWQKCHNSWDCRILDPVRPVDVMVIGDSHAGHLGTGLAAIYGERGLNVSVRQRSMCLPLFPLQRDGKTYFDCVGFIARALQESMASPSVRQIILSGYANRFIYQYPDGVPGNANLREINSDTATVPNAQHVAALAQGLDQTLAQLVHSGKQVVFLVDNPELDFEPRECVSARPVTLPGHRVRTPCAMARTAYEARAADYLRIVSAAQAKFPTVRFVRTDRVLCDAELCWAMKEGELLYSDRSHLTPAGSRHVLTALQEQIR